MSGNSGTLALLLDGLVEHAISELLAHWGQTEPVDLSEEEETQAVRDLYCWLSVVDADTFAGEIGMKHGSWR